MAKIIKPSAEEYEKLTGQKIGSLVNGTVNTVTQVITVRTV